MKKRVTYHIQVLGGIILMVLTLSFITSCSDTMLDEEGKDVSQANSSFVWARSSDTSTRLAFLRNFGVGYSYDAVEGDYCNWNGIRCQVVNRNVLERIEQVIPTVNLYGKTTVELASHSSKYTYNKRDYVAGIRLDTKVAVDLGLYSNTKRTRQDVLEDGVREQFYYSTDYSLIKGKQWLDEENMFAYIRDEEFVYMLTESFRNAVEHMKHAVYEEKHDEMYLTAMVDSFIKVYGTHVIVSATLGARLQLDLAHDMWRYNDKVKETEWTAEQILFAYSERKKNRKEEIYKFIENTSIYVSAYGGDQSYLKDFMGKTQYDGTRTFDASTAIEKWAKSVKFDDDDDKNSNVELVDMRVRPIWDFIEPLDYDEEVVERVKAEIMQDISYQQEQLGNASLFNTCFSLNIDDPKLMLRAQSGGYHTVHWSDVYQVGAKDITPIVNIVSGGKYVATICKEEIDSAQYTTVYPIYNGKIAYQEGLAFNDDNVYRMKWSYGFNKYVLQVMDQTDVPQRDSIYINDGALSLVKQKDLTYTESHPMLYLEVTGGVQYDGSFLWNAIFLPAKRGKDFILPYVAKSQDPEKLIGWYWDDKKELMVRNDSTYTYIYNPTEMDYVE